jgi:hypothetical protein
LLRGEVGDNGFGFGGADYFIQQLPVLKKIINSKMVLI